MWLVSSSQHWFSNLAKSHFFSITYDFLKTKCGPISRYYKDSPCLWQTVFFSPIWTLMLLFVWFQKAALENGGAGTILFIALSRWVRSQFWYHLNKKSNPKTNSTQFQNIWLLLSQTQSSSYYTGYQTTISPEWCCDS